MSTGVDESPVPALIEGGAAGRAEGALQHDGVLLHRGHICKESKLKNQ